MRVVFFGSPDYALPTLRALLDAPDVDLVAAVTQPDRPRGRSGSAVPTAVAHLAREAGLAVLTPDRIRREQTAAIAALEPDVGVLAASAHILPSHLIEAFPHGILNVHASLLPWHRGASPVAAAILAGDEQAGASIMEIVRELDAGPMLGAAATPIEAARHDRHAHRPHRRARRKAAARAARPLGRRRDRGPAPGRGRRELRAAARQGRRRPRLVAARPRPLAARPRLPAVAAGHDPLPRAAAHHPRGLARLRSS